MINHSSVAFENDLFMALIMKVRNGELYYQSIDFYLDEQPSSLTRLLTLLTPKLNHTRVVHQARKRQELPLFATYMKSVQKDDIKEINQALNEMYVTEEDFSSLRESIDQYENFDQLSLAQSVEKHVLLEFRRIASYVYKKNKRWEQSINLSKADKMYKDAIDTASASGEMELAEDLLSFFVEGGDKECFAATLYTCSTLVRPDVVMEIAWRNGLMDFAFPYLIQYVRTASDLLKEVDDRTRPKEAAQDAAAQGADPSMYGNGGMLALGDGSMGMGMPQQGMGGMGMGMPQQGGMGMGMQQGGMGMGMQQGGMGMGMGMQQGGMQMQPNTMGGF
jgi:clathrin heavy chain